MDKNIIFLGTCFYWKLKGKEECKSPELYKTVRQDMRRLAYCYKHFKDRDEVNPTYGNSRDMFCRENFDQLAGAVEEYTSSEDTGEIKPRLKDNLCYLIKNFAIRIKHQLFNKREDSKAEEMMKFIQCWKAHKSFLFNDARTKLNKNRQVNLSKPHRLPLEEDLKVLRNHDLLRMKEICSEFTFTDAHSFVELRNLAVTRLTLLNGRGGGEPARIQLEEWEDADSNAWIDQQRVKDLDKVDQFLVKSMKIAYMCGKGNNHLVPVLIPVDNVSALNKLADQTFRKQALLRKIDFFLRAPNHLIAMFQTGMLLGQCVTPLKWICILDQILLPQRTVTE